MRRDVLTRLVSTAATAAGYAFHTGEEHTAGATVRDYPAAWLAPPTLTGRTGRGEGDETWTLALHLMALPEGVTAAEDAWRALEADAAGIVRALADAPEVCAVGEVSCKPRRQALTAHGECSVTLGCEVTIWYYL